jgi:hypothetical protein
MIGCRFSRLRSTREFGVLNATVRISFMRFISKQALRIGMRPLRRFTLASKDFSESSSPNLAI